LGFFFNVTDFACIGFTDIQFPNLDIFRNLKNLYLEGATVDSDYIIDGDMWPLNERDRYDFPNLELITIKNYRTDNLQYLSMFIKKIINPSTQIRLENLQGDVSELGEIKGFHSFPKNMKTALISSMDTAERRELERVVRPQNFLGAIDAENPRGNVRHISNKLSYYSPDKFYGELQRYANESETQQQQRKQGNINAVKPRPMGTPDTPSPPKLASHPPALLPTPPSQEVALHAPALPNAPPPKLASHPPALPNPPTPGMASSAQRHESPPELTQQVSAKVTIKPTPKRHSAPRSPFGGGGRHKTRRHRASTHHTRGRRRRRRRT
jgi:hypothetical protein